MKKLLLLFLIALHLLPAKASVQLSDSSRVSLLTCYPGEELYSAFGHTGIRVTDYVNVFDVVFNYGTFDFDQPGFYTNFLRGEMRYMITTDNFRLFKRMYEYENRRVEEMELHLNNEQKKGMFNFLYTNALPENREYRYDFFWDNCATRPRDVIEKAAGPGITYTYEGFDTTGTMRQALKPYVAQMPWVDFGFDLILGLPCEVRATARNQTFLPDKLALMLKHSSVNGQPLTGPVTPIVDIPFNPTPYSGITPIMVTFFILTLSVAIGVIERVKNVHVWGFDFALFFTAGLFGTFFLCMWLFTVHYSVPKNLNMLWLIPLHLPVSFMLLRKNKPDVLAYYFIGTFAVMVLLLVTWAWNPQPYNIAVLPLILALANRAFKIFVRFKQLKHA